MGCCLCKCKGKERDYQDPLPDTMATRKRMSLPPGSNPLPSEFYSYADPKASILKRLGRRLGSSSSKKKPREGNIPLPPIPQENSTELYIDDRAQLDIQTNPDRAEQRPVVEIEYLPVEEGTQGNLVEDTCYACTNSPSPPVQSNTKGLVEEDFYVNMTPPQMEGSTHNLLSTDDVYMNTDQVSGHELEQCHLSMDDVYINADEVSGHELEQSCVTEDDVYVNSNQVNGQETELPSALYESIHQKLPNRRINITKVVDINNDTTPMSPQYYNVSSDPSYYNVGISTTVNVHSSQSDTQLEEPNVYEAVDY